MGKKIFAILMIAVVATFAGYNIYQSQRTETMSDLMLANVEAFAAQGEYDQPYYVAPCQNHSGSECRSTKYDEGNRCGKLSYC